MAIEVQYDYLHEVDGSIRLLYKGTADFLIARKKSQDTVEVIDIYVAPANQKNGYGKEMVEFLLNKCVQCKIRNVTIKSNENPDWWQKAKGFKNGYLIST